MQILKHWIKQVLVALDQFVNAVFLGWADETFSARCWRLRERPLWGLARRVVDLPARIFRDKNHCEASYRSEQLRLQCPPELRPPEVTPEVPEGGSDVP
jgi:hypothetical protein